MKRKQYVILGLGIFGSTIAKTLSKYDCEVIAIDRNLTCVDRVSDFVTQAVQADFTDIEQLKSIDISDCDAAVVATGSHLEESILAVMNLKELGIPYVLAKAKNKSYMKVLLKIGADRVIRPEKEMGESVAKGLLSRNIIDMIDIDGDYSLIEIKASPKWIGKSLRELDLRNRSGINVLGIRKKPGEKLSISPDADYVIESEDQLMVVADTHNYHSVSLLDDIVKE